MTRFMQSIVDPDSLRIVIDYVGSEILDLVIPVKSFQALTNRFNAIYNQAIRTGQSWDPKYSNFFGYDVQTDTMPHYAIDPVRRTWVKNPPLCTHPRCIIVRLPEGCRVCGLHVYYKRDNQIGSYVCSSCRYKRIAQHQRDAKLRDAKLRDAKLRDAKLREM